MSFPLTSRIAETIEDKNAPWRINSSIKARLELKSFNQASSFKKCLLLESDRELEFVTRYFNQSKPPHLKIKRVYCLEHLDSLKSFEETIFKMDAVAQKSTFEPRWKDDPEADTRKAVIERWKTIGDLFSPISLEDGTKTSQVRLFPLWYGTNLDRSLSIASGGFTFFGKRLPIETVLEVESSSGACGQFGNGIYFTDSAHYASLSGPTHLLLAWVVMKEPYPVINDQPHPEKGRDIEVLQGKGAYSSHDAHYIPVASLDPTNPLCTKYYPCYKDQKPDWDEVVIFERFQALARFWVELDKEGSSYSYNFSEAMALAEEGNLPKLKTWIEENPSRLHEKTLEGETLAYGALVGDQLPVLKWLYGQDPSLIEHVRNDRKSLAFLAVLGGRKKILGWLIDEGIVYYSSLFTEEAERFGYTKDRIAKALKEVGWSIWKIPSKPLCFLERRDLLSKLDDKFFLAPKEGLVKVTLTGEEGVGKSSLAVAYAHEFQDRYSLVWWIGGGKPLPSGLKDLGIELGLFSRDTPEEEFLKKVFEHLNKSAPWLLILDQIESPSLLDPLFSSLNKGHILITSRDPSSPNSLSIDTFSSHESLALFNEYTKYPLGEEGEELAKVLSHLPLALNLAGAYMAETGTSYKSYLDAYLQKKDPSISSLHEATMRTVLRISLDHLKATSPEVLPFLYRALYLAPNKIPPSLLSEEGLSPLKCRSFLNLFKRYGLLQSEEDLTTFSIDKLIQKVLREDLSPQEAKETKETLGKNLKKEWRFSGDCPDTWNHAKPLVPHLQALVRLGGAAREMVAASFLEGLGIYFRKVEVDLPLSIKYLTQSLKIWDEIDDWDKVDCKETPDFTATLDSLGHAYYDQGDLAQAIDCFNRALQVRKKVYGEEDSSTATSLNSLGNVYQGQGNLLQAIDFYNQALMICKKTYQEEHHDIGSCLSNLGSAYQEKGDHFQAIDYHNQALQLFKKIYNENHPSIAGCLNNLGNVHLEGNTSKAIDLYRQALQIRTAVYGGEHPEVAITLDNLGVAYRGQGNLVKSIEHHHRSLSILKKVYGEEDIHLATALSSLGNSYVSQGNFSEAIEIYNQVLKIRKKTFGEEHFSVANTLNNLGGAYRGQGNLIQAIECYKQAFAIFKKVYGEENPSVATTLSNLGNSYISRKNFSQGIESLSQALLIRKKIYGEEHLDVATNLNSLGTAYKASENFSEAANFYSQALKIFREALGENHFSTAMTISYLGSVLEAQGNFTQAIDHYSKALESFKKEFGEESVYVATTINNLGGIYKVQGDLAQAISYYNQALKIFKTIHKKEHATIATTLNNLATAYQDQKELPQAIELYLEALKTYNKVYGQEHPNIANTLINLGNAYKEIGDLSEAIKAYHQALEIREKFYGKSHSTSAVILKKLGDAYHAQGNLTQATEFENKAAKVRKKNSEDKQELLTSSKKLKLDGS